MAYDTCFSVSKNEVIRLGNLEVCIKYGPNRSKDTPTVAPKLRTALLAKEKQLQKIKQKKIVYQYFVNDDPIGHTHPHNICVFF